MESTACARKDRAQEQPLTPPEPGDRAPGTRGHRDFRDQKEKSATANGGPRLADRVGLGWPKVGKTTGGGFLDRTAWVNRGAVRCEKPSQNI